MSNPLLESLATGFQYRDTHRITLGEPLRKTYVAGGMGGRHRIYPPQVEGYESIQIPISPDPVSETDRSFLVTCVSDWARVAGHDVDVQTHFIEVADPKEGQMYGFYVTGMVR